MRMKRITCLLVALGAVVLLTALTGRQTQSAAPDGFRFEAAELKDKTRWTQVNAEPYHISSALDGLCRAPMPANYEAERKSNPHAATYITVYVNRVGRKAMFAKESQRFPEGSVIVKEKIGISSDGRTPLLYTIMIKRERGYNPAVGDWEFLVASGDGKQIEASGKLENCQACHLTRTDSDFVFRPYLTAK
jgi:hypothetical protein